MTLLARHAENLFWIGRLVERAETVARLFEVGSRNALIPNTAGGFRNEWNLSCGQRLGRYLQGEIRGRHSRTKRRELPVFRFRQSLVRRFVY